MFFLLYCVHHVYSLLVLQHIIMTDANLDAYKDHIFSFYSFSVKNALNVSHTQKLCIIGKAWTVEILLQDHLSWPPDLP